MDNICYHRNFGKSSCSLKCMDYTKCKEYSYGKARRDGAAAAMFKRDNKKYKVKR